ncbi:MAG TPA: GNAT family N-acetyltransferase [Isosphaeraceae bacterium]
MTDYQFLLEEHPTDQDYFHVVRNLVQFNDSRGDPEHWRQLGVFIRDSSGAILGGLLGFTHWNWLFVSHLWVADTLRGRDYGGELMRRAEAEARRRGCRHAHLDTFSFQARGFYEKLGYEVFGCLADYPPGHSRYFLRKALVDAVAPPRAEAVAGEPADPV